ncbi:MAG TPA: hypothetical protein DDX70_11490 [Bacteroides sp.]|nr:hypothetical protein [Bacteroides sp.]
MKKVIEIELPDFIDDSFISIMSLLTPQELSQLKGVATGLLLGSGRYTVDDITAIICKGKE